MSETPPTPLGIETLDTGRTPAEWCKVFAERGIDISERTLRAKARLLGACHVIGNAMLITPGQIEIILQNATVRSKHLVHPREPRGGSRTPDISVSALEHLRRAQAKRPERPGRRKKP